MKFQDVAGSGDRAAGNPAASGCVILDHLGVHSVAAGSFA